MFLIRVIFILLVTIVGIACFGALMSGNIGLCAIFVIVLFALSFIFELIKTYRYDKLEDNKIKEYEELKKINENLYKNGNK